MSGSASIGTEQAVLGHTLGYAPMPPVGQVFVALCYMMPVSSEATGGTEVSGGGYTRVPATFALIDAPANLAANTVTVEYPTATANWGAVAYFELWDSLSGGNRLYWGPIIDPVSLAPIVINVMATDIVRFSAGALTVQAAPVLAGATSTGAYLPLAGGTLTGPLTLAADPTLPLVAATKQYVDAHVAPGAPFVPVTNPITAAPGMLPFKGDIYQSADAYALTGSMTFRGMPYGYYDTGTLLSIVATTGPLSSSRAGINGGFENGVPAIAGYGSFDTVNIYSGIRSEPPPLVLHSVTYDATHVYPHSPLTAAQTQKLRTSMYVMTNSINTTVITTPAVPNGVKPENHYAGLVTGWAADGSSITVSGWTVPGSHITAAGQVPPVGTLDPGAANATAYFGSATNMFGGNFMAQHDPINNPDSRTKSYQGIEFDFQNYGTTDYEMAVTGLALNYDPINGVVKPTADSCGMILTGFPTGIKLGYNNVALNIDPNTVTTAIISGALNVFGIDSPAPWTGTPTTNLTWETTNFIDSNVMRLQCWVSRDAAGGGWPTASMHLGLRVDGTPLELVGGVLMGQIVWAGGGITLENGAGAQPIQVDPNGYVHLAGLTNAANDAAAATAGVPVTGVYRNGSVLMVRVS